MNKPRPGQRVVMVVGVSGMGPPIGTLGLVEDREHRRKDTVWVRFEGYTRDIPVVVTSLALPEGNT